MASLPALLIEAFSAEPLQGNGAGVVLLDAPASSAWMQGLASSLRQSETAFLWRDPRGAWLLRWFTPSCEVPLCGHATLAAALGLHHWGRLQSEVPLQLWTRSGGLEVAVSSAELPQVSVTLPSSGLIDEPEPPAYLGPLLRGAPLRYWSSPLGYRVVLLAPDVPLEQLQMPVDGLQGEDRNGLVVMQAAHDLTPALAGEPCDYQLRFFAPGLGIDEDPVTGSAHALVAPWWMQRLQRQSVRGWQASHRRGGMLCEAVHPGFVRLSGTGHLLWDGQIHAPGCGADPLGWQVPSSS